MGAEVVYASLEIMLKDRVRVAKKHCLAECGVWRSWTLWLKTWQCHSWSRYQPARKAFSPLSTVAVEAVADRSSVSPDGFTQYPCSPIQTTCSSAFARDTVKLPIHSIHVVLSTAVAPLETLPRHCYRGKERWYRVESRKQRLLNVYHRYLVPVPFQYTSPHSPSWVLRVPMLGYFTRHTLCKAGKA